MTITLKLIEDNVGALQFQELQRQVWQSPEDDLVPLHVSITVARNGGGLLGAYAEDGPKESGGLVGIAFWWLGADNRSSPIADGQSGSPPASALKVCSHMTGVLPGWQGRGIGLQLKLAQRELVLKQGLTDRITWTFDPLFVANAVFNMHRLGAICSTYYANYYGEMRDGLNKGTPSDRCQVDWWLNSRRVVDAAGGVSGSPTGTTPELEVLAIERDARGFTVPMGDQPALDGRPVALPLPDDIAAIRRTSAELSLTWRLYVREVLQQAFSAGYQIIDCRSLKSAHYYYILAPKRKEHA